MSPCSDGSRDWRIARSLLASSSPSHSVVRHFLITSPLPGNGKSYAACTWGCPAPGEVFRITMTPDTSAPDLRGYYITKKGDFEFLYGPCAEAMKSGRRLVIDEVDQAGPDAMALLRSVLDTPRYAQLYLPTGEVIRPAPGFHVVATSNALPEDLPGPLADRFTIIKVAGHNPDLVAMLPEDLRKLAEKMGRHSAPARYVSLRCWFDFAGLRQHPELELDDAARLAFGHRATELIDALKLSASPYVPR